MRAQIYGAKSKSTKFVKLLIKKETICVRAKVRELAINNYAQAARTHRPTRLIGRILLSAARSVPSLGFTRRSKAPVKPPYLYHLAQNIFGAQVI